MTVQLIPLILIGSLTACGVYLLLERNLTRILLGLFLVGNALNLLILTVGGKSGKPPIHGRDSAASSADSDPLVQAMILTAIVITMGVAAFVLALTYRSFTLSARDEVENDPEDTKVSQRRTRADAPDRDRSDDPVTGEPSKIGDAFDSAGNPIPLEELTNIEDLECYEDLHDGDFDDETDSAYSDGEPARGDDAPSPRGGTR